MRTILDRYQPVAVMHFAAFAYVGESVEQPLLYYRNNVAGSTALFRAIIETRTIPMKSKVARKQTAASRPVEAKRKRQKAKTGHKRSGAKKSGSRRPSGTTPPSPPVQTETTIVDVIDEPIPLV